MSKGIKFKNRNNEYIYPCPFYPVGSLYESSNSTNPSTYFGGTWECVYNDYDYRHIVSQVVHPGANEINVGAGGTNKTVLQGAYADQFQSLQRNFTCPPGYEFRYRWSMIVTTNGNLECCLRINDKQVTDFTKTWSGELFREVSTGGFYKLGTDITPKSTTDIGYTTNGYVYSLYLRSSSSASQKASIWDITAHLYVVSKYKVYKWRRTA